MCLWRVCSNRFPESCCGRTEETVYRSESEKLARKFSSVLVCADEGSNKCVCVVEGELLSVGKTVFETRLSELSYILMD